MESCGGSRAITVAGGGTTLMPADALVPFRGAVIPAWPYASPDTGTVAVSCPPRTVAVAGMSTMPAGLAASATTVSVACTDEIVTLTVVAPPSAMLASAGTTETGLGAAPVTVTWLDAAMPLTLAVICVAPADSAVTGIAALVSP